MVIPDPGNSWKFCKQVTLWSLRSSQSHPRFPFPPRHPGCHQGYLLDRLHQSWAPKNNTGPKRPASVHGEAPCWKVSPNLSYTLSKNPWPKDPPKIGGKISTRCWSASSRNSSCGSAAGCCWTYLLLHVVTVCPKWSFELVLTRDVFKVVGQNGFHLNISEHIWTKSLIMSYDTILQKNTSGWPAWAVLPTTFPQTMEVQVPFHILTWRKGSACFNGLL